MSNHFDIIPNIVPKRRCLCRKIAGCFRSKNQMPTLKTDGQNCDVLLLVLRNEFNLQLNGKIVPVNALHKYKSRIGKIQGFCR